MLHDKRIAVLVLYFGDWPAWIPLTFNSMRDNPEIDWIIFTDQQPTADSSLLDVRLISWPDMVKRIQDHFPFPVGLENPYKLCDFRPSYGRIFESELAGYDYWGHCDVDLIFGHIAPLLPAPALECDRVLQRGNFSLYRNAPEINDLYLFEARLEQILSSPSNFQFDEWGGINSLCETHDMTTWLDTVIFDIQEAEFHPRANDTPRRFKPRYIKEGAELWEYIWNGIAYRRSRRGALIHLQKRQMNWSGASFPNRYTIEPSSFGDGRTDGTRVRFGSTLVERGIFAANRLRRRSRNAVRKLRQRVGAPS